MSISTTERTIEITLRHPDGSIRLAVPTDVPLGELMPDFLDVTGQPDGDGWVLSPDGANPYPSEQNAGRARASTTARRSSSTNSPRRRCLPPRASRRERPTPRAAASTAIHGRRTSPERADRAHAAGEALAPGSLLAGGESSGERLTSAPRRREPPAPGLPGRPPSPARRASRRWRGCARRGGAPTTSTAWTSWSSACGCGDA